MKYISLAEVFSPHPNGQRKPAFTLAEVLITLGIIGVVAAITMPNLIEKHQKQVAVTALKEGYALLNNAVQRANNEYGENVYNGDAIEMLAAIRPYLNAEYGSCRTKNSGSDKYLNGNNGVSYTFANHAINQTTPNNSTILLPNGMCIAYSNGTYLAIDINGAKKPNTYGKDIFSFRFDTNKQMFVDPVSITQAFNASQAACNLNSQFPGTYCSSVIIQSGWTIPKEYPW